MHLEVSREGPTVIATHIQPVPPTIEVAGYVDGMDVYDWLLSLTLTEARDIHAKLGLAIEKFVEQYGEGGK